MNSPVIEVNKQVRQIFTEVQADIEQYFDRIWQCAELPCMEFESVRLLSDWLEKEGFAVESDLCGIPTAFAATWGEEGPTVGIFAEYDALPGVGNDKTAYRQSLGAKGGHGCGHNHIGAANIGAAIVAKRFLEQQGLNGRIRILGCPAEEILWGKIAVFEHGGIGKPDVFLTSHGDYQNGVLSRPCHSVLSGEVRFFGHSGHAGISGHSAMEAMEIAMQTISRSRQEHFPDAVIRSVVRRGGDCPAVVPSEAGIWFSARSDVYETAKQAYEFVLQICQRVADESDLQVRCEYVSGSHGYLPNDVLANVLFKNMQEVGPPKWSDDDVAWQEELVKSFRTDGKFNLDRDIDLYQEGIDYYGQDDGEVSWHIPLGRVNWAVPEQVPIHHWAYTALSGNKAGYAGPLMASETLALATVEIIQNPQLIDTAQKEMIERREGFALPQPKAGAFEILTKAPQKFWDGSWLSDD